MTPYHSYLRFSRSLPARPKPRVPGAPNSNGYWTVPELCAAYNWPAGATAGLGSVIAIVELGGGWVQSDIDAYFASIGQPSPSITDISVDGTANTPDPSANSADFEVALDIEVAGASYFAATGQPATIRVYWAQDIGAAVAAASGDGCDVCSISWGADEASWGPDALNQMEATAAAATAAGMVIFAASGDNDSSDGGPTPANVDAPASCPHVIGCGGTSKTATSETVWNANPGQTDGQGTGGGYSSQFPAQAWQLNAAAPPAQPTTLAPGSGRMVPDVAANADPVTGYVIYCHGQEVDGIGGTSAVAPLYAGLFAALGRHLGFISPLLWANPTAFTEITVGENGTYSAGPQPNACCGLGSIIGTAALWIRCHCDVCS